MGGEPGMVTVRWAPRQELPDDYVVFWTDGLYYWWHKPTDVVGGECWDRWRVRREAIAHSKREQG